MSYSWAFVGELVLPRAGARSFQRKHPAGRRRRGARAIGEPDFVYDGVRVRHYRVCDKSEYATLVTELRALFAELAAIGAKGEGSVVGFVDGAPDDAGLRLSVAGGEVSEAAIRTKSAVRAVQRSALFTELVQRLEHAAAPSRQPRGAAERVRAEVLAALDRVSDTKLLAGARATDIRVEVPGKGRYRTVHLADRHTTAEALRAALREGDSTLREADLNRAPFAVLAAVDPRTAVDLARRLVDAKVDPADPTVGGAVRALAVSKDDADLERIFRSFRASAGVFGGSDALERSVHPGADRMALAELTKLIGQPGNWRPPSGTNALALALANVLDERRCPQARPILAAAKMKRSSPYWFLFRYIRATARDAGR